jgi:serum/glucocorticoid-regulated kinase 2
MLNENNHSSQDINIESFEIVKVVGRGSFGKVYMVKKKDDGVLFAMKTLKKDLILRRN